MKSFKLFTTLTINLILAIAIGVGISAATGINPAIPTSIVFGTGLIPGFSFAGVLSMALQTEVWVRDIQEVLFEGNEFITKSIDDGVFVNNLVVHLPQSGANPGIEVNRTDLPAPIAQRDDLTPRHSFDIRE